MNKSEIIKIFLKDGYQLDKPTLEYFTNNQADIQVFLEKIKNYEKKPQVITLKLIRKFIRPSDALRVIKDYHLEPQEHQVRDYTNLLNKRYENLRKILLKKLKVVSPISISKISPKTKKFSLLTIVREKNQTNHSLIVEDMTGVIEVTFPDGLLDEFKLILEDEVVGLVCENGNNITVRSVIWPDIPLRRVVTKTKQNIHCLFISGVNNKTRKFKEKSFNKFLAWLKNSRPNNLYTFIFGDVSSQYLKKIEQTTKGKVFVVGDMKNLEQKLSDPISVKIGGVGLFLSSGSFFQSYKKLWGLPLTEICLNLIKKHHLKPTINLNQPIDVGDPFFLDTIPDIFVCGSSEKPSVINHKGTTILSTGSFLHTPIFWLVDLHTRELFKLEFT